MLNFMHSNKFDHISQHKKSNPLTILPFIDIFMRDDIFNNFN